MGQRFKMAEKGENSSSQTPEFSRVILTLDNVLIPADKLSPTPSMLDGLDSDTETDLRILGCELIQTSGILLRLPQVAMATGQVLFQRFYYSKSFVKHNMEVLAMACVNLASKIEEAPRRIRDVVNVFHHIKQVKAGKHIKPLILDQDYINLKNQVIKAERRVLKELGFCVHVQHPHKTIVTILQVYLECERNTRLIQAAWNYMNDSFRTDVFVRFQPYAIACACIYLAARQLKVPLPNNPPWYLIFSVDEAEIQDICLTLLKLYNRPKPNADKLEQVVNEAKQIQIETKKKLKGIFGSGSNTPNSRANSPKTVSPSPNPGVRALAEEDKSDRSGSLKDYNHVKRKKRDQRDHSRSRSRSPSVPKSYKNRYNSSRSRSPSHSPSPKNRKHRSPPRKYKKDKVYSRYEVKEKSRNSRKRRHSRSPTPRSRSRSLSHSPERDMRQKHKKYYKEKVKYRSRSRSKERSHKSKKHSSNGHRRSRSRERYRR